MARGEEQRYRGRRTTRRGTQAKNSFTAPLDTRARPDPPPHLRARERVRQRARRRRHERPAAAAARLDTIRRCLACTTTAAGVRRHQVAVQGGSFLEGDKCVAYRRHVPRGACGAEREGTHFRSGAGTPALVQRRRGCRLPECARAAAAGFAPGQASANRQGPELASERSLQAAAFPTHLTLLP